VTEGTIICPEGGDQGIRMKTFAQTLLALGELHRLDGLLHPSQDATGLLLDQERLPMRVGSPRRRALTTAGSSTRPSSATW